MMPAGSGWGAASFTTSSAPWRPRTEAVKVVVEPEATGARDDEVLSLVLQVACKECIDERWPRRERAFGCTFAALLDGDAVARGSDPPRVLLTIIDQARAITGRRGHAWGFGLKLATPLHHR